MLDSSFINYSMFDKCLQHTFFAALSPLLAEVHVLVKIVWIPLMYIGNHMNFKFVRLAWVSINNVESIGKRVSKNEEWILVTFPSSEIHTIHRKGERYFKILYKIVGIGRFNGVRFKTGEIQWESSRMCCSHFSFCFIDLPIISNFK